VSSIDQQQANQMANIEKATGRSLAEWITVIEASGLEKHGQILAWLKSEHGLSHGNANLLALRAREASTGAPQGDDDLVASHYAGKNASLRPLYDQVVATAIGFGTDIELAPKKTYVSLRRRKQFATVGPAAGKLEVCLNLPGKAPTDRLKPTTGMATHKLRLDAPDALDAELVGWLNEAYDRAG
jgi:hypothetical protein